MVMRTFEVEQILAEIAHEFDTASTTIAKVDAVSISTIGNGFGGTSAKPIRLLGEGGGQQ
jgi:hypothetical protein